MHDLFIIVMFELFDYQHERNCLEHNKKNLSRWYNVRVSEI